MKQRASAPAKDLGVTDETDEAAAPRYYAVVCGPTNGLYRFLSAQAAADFAAGEARKRPGIEFIILSPTQVCCVKLPPANVCSYESWLTGEPTPTPTE